MQNKLKPLNGNCIRCVWGLVFNDGSDSLINWQILMQQRKINQLIKFNAIFWGNNSETLDQIVKFLAKKREDSNGEIFFIYEPP